MTGEHPARCWNCKYNGFTPFTAPISVGLPRWTSTTWHHEIHQSRKDKKTKKLIVVFSVLKSFG